MDKTPDSFVFETKKKFGLTNDSIRSMKHKGIITTNDYNHLVKERGSNSYIQLKLQRTFNSLESHCCTIINTTQALFMRKNVSPELQNELLIIQEKLHSLSLSVNTDSDFEMISDFLRLF